jgi:rubrerythrin
MQNVDEFLAHAIRLEEDAANRLGDLAHAMKISGNHDSAAFFGKLAHFSRLHLAQARARAGYHDLPELKAHEFEWPDGESPEATSMEASHYLMDLDYAMQLSLESEQRGFDFYDEIARTTEDPEIRMMAVEFAAEEAEHVAELKRWMANLEAKPKSN